MAYKHKAEDAADASVKFESRIVEIVEFVPSSPELELDIVEDRAGGLGSSDARYLHLTEPVTWASEHGTVVCWHDRFRGRISSSRERWGSCPRGMPMPPDGPRGGPTVGWLQPVGTWRAPFSRIGEASNPGPSGLPRRTPAPWPWVGILVLVLVAASRLRDGGWAACRPRRGLRHRLGASRRALRPPARARDVIRRLSGHRSPGTPAPLAARRGCAVSGLPSRAGGRRVPEPGPARRWEVANGPLAPLKGERMSEIGLGRGGRRCPGDGADGTRRARYAPAGRPAALGACEVGALVCARPAGDP